MARLVLIYLISAVAFATACAAAGPTPGPEQRAWYSVGQGVEALDVGTFTTCYRDAPDHRSLSCVYRSS